MAQEKCAGNGHKPGPIPDEDPSGKHVKPDDQDNKDDEDDKGMAE
jgi:hypothetical protein